MSRIETLSTFYYGHTVTRDNQNIDFDEGAGELTAVLSPGDYTATEFATLVSQAMTAVGSQNYTVVFNRTTRKNTISSVANFTLRTNTGTHAGSDAYGLIGFTTVANHTGTNTYTGENASGFEYRPQLVLFDYTSLDDWSIKESAVVNISANGVVQTLQWGDGQRMECEIRGITNLTGLNRNGTLFYENATGEAAARSFLSYLITKAKVEFMPDVASRSTKFDLILESSEADAKGTKFKLLSMAKYWLKTGKLVFRKVTV